MTNEINETEKNLYEFKEDGIITGWYGIKEPVKKESIFKFLGIEELKQ